MKKVEKRNKYKLVSGDEEINRAATVKELVNFIGASWSWAYANKNKNINGDGTWSFNFEGYNYTIINIENDEK
jgi:hypothetical protein